MDRPSISSRTVLWGLALSLVLGFVGGLYVFDRFTTYVPSALSRAPEQVVRCTRLSLQQGVLYEPFVEFVLPVFERGKRGPEPRVKLLERKTSLELNVDVRELVLLDLPDGRWLWIAAGFLRQEKTLSGVENMAKEEGIPLARKGDTLQHASGITFAVAEDGTLLLGSDEGVVIDAQRRNSKPSWASDMESAGVAVAVHVAPRDDLRGSEPPSHLLGGTLLVQADTYFPTDGSFLLDGESWTSEQTDQLLLSRAGDTTYLFPLEALRTRQVAAGLLSAHGSLGRPRFDAAIERLARQIEARLPPIPAPIPPK